MSDDRELADLLGETPGADPNFRAAVFARIGEYARRRSARFRAMRTIAVFTAIGGVFPFARASGLTLSDLQPLFLVAGLLGGVGIVALWAIEGGKGLAARSMAVLRGI